MSWTVGQLVQATGGRLIAGEPSAPVTGISLDSRTLKAGEAFVAIRGNRFDAHAFLPQAVARGAACVIVSNVPPSLPHGAVIAVEDTTQALGAVAAFHRRRFHIPVIAVTGSCGKTTTKDFIAHLLNGDRQVLKTQGTQNNHIGLPMTLLRLSRDHAAAVVELGSNHPGEIAYLARIAQPTVAVITNIGPAHLEFFGSLDVVRQEKLSLVESLEPGGTAVVPGDQLDVLLGAKTHLPLGRTLLTFGTSEQCGVCATDVSRHEASFSMRLRGVSGTFEIPLPGSHNVENALAALTCLKALGISLESVQARLASAQPAPLRSQLIRTDTLTILNDCYNANPLSFARALDVLRTLEVNRKIVIAGDMLELGAFAPAAHQAIGRLCVQAGADRVIAVGEFAEEIGKGVAQVGSIEVMVFRTVAELLPHLATLLRPGDGVLVKGSRKLQLEQVTMALLEDEATLASGAAMPSLR